MRRLLLLAGALVLSVHCAGARHVAVVADASFAQVVFALDDAEFQACVAHVLTTAQCEAANPKIKQALLDVKAATKAIQDTPKNAQPPTSLVSLLADLTAVQTIIGDLSPGPVKKSLTDKITTALGQALSLLQLYTDLKGS